MQNFKTSRFEFTPQFVPSEEIDSPLAVSSRNPSLSKSSDRAYPRRDELFQDENGNLYLYKVINGVHKYVKIPADGTSGSDNGDLVNKHVYLPYERLAKLSATGINSAVFEDGTIATVENNSLKFYKHNVMARELEQISTISLNNDVAEYFQHKFVGFTYATDNTSFRVLIGYKVTGDYNPTITVHAFRLISNLSSIDTTYKLEPFGSMYSWNAGQVNSSCSIHMLRDNEDSIRLFVHNAIIKADITNSTIAYDTIDTLVYKAISGNSNAVLIQKYRDSGLYLYMRSDGVVININNDSNNDTHKLAILNVKRENTRPGYTGMYGIVSALNHSPSEANPTNSSVYTTDFDANNPVKTDFSINLGDNETIVKIIDNTPILNHSNIQNGYEKMVMSFVVISKLESKYNAYLYYVVPESAIVHNGGADANEPYEDSKYSVLCVGKYQFSESEEITNLESGSYLYYLDNENILENRSNSIAIYAASQFKYLAASFADSLFAASLQAINAEMEYAKAKLIKNDEMMSKHIYADEITAKKSSLEEIKVNSIDINPKANHQTTEMDEYDILDDDGNKALNLYAPLSDNIRQGDSRSVFYKNYIIHLGLGLVDGVIVQKVLYVFDVESNKQYKINYEWGNSILEAIPTEDNQGRVCININKYGNLYGTVCCRNAMYNFYLTDSIDDIIRTGNSVTFVVEEDTTSDPDNIINIEYFKENFYFNLRTDTSIIYVILRNNVQLSFREVSLELISSEEVSDKFNVYDSYNNKIITNTYSFHTYYRNVGITTIASHITKFLDINSSVCFNDLYYGDYIFVPVESNITSDNHKLFIIRVFAPHIKLNEYSSVEFYNNEVKVNDIYYSGLNEIYKGSENSLPITALSENCVRYVDIDGNIVDAYFKSKLSAVDASYKDISMTTKATDNVSVIAKRYLVSNHRIYEYFSWQTYNLIIKEVNTLENNFDVLVMPPSLSADTQSAVYMLGKYILYTYKDTIENKYKLDRKYNPFSTINGKSISATNADIANINTGKIHAEKVLVENLKISNLNISAKEGIYGYNGLTASDKEVIFNSANEFINRNCKADQVTYIPGQQASIYLESYAYDIQAYGANENLYSIMRSNIAGSKYAFFVSVTKDNSFYYLSINFRFFNDYDHKRHESLDILNNGLNNIKLFPIYSPTVIDANYFTRITDPSEYDYSRDNNYYLSIPSNNIGTNNIFNKPVYNNTTHTTDITLTAPDGTELVSSIRLGCKSDSTGNVYIFFDTIKILNEEVFLSDNPLVIQIDNTNKWKVFNDDHYSESRIHLYKIPYIRILQSYNIVTNLNYINETMVDTKKVVYLPVLIKGNNDYSAINNGMMIGIVNDNYSNITWNFVNLCEVPSGSSNNPLDAYLQNVPSLSYFTHSRTDIELKHIPYVTAIDRYTEGNVTYFRMAVNAVKAPDALSIDKVSRIQPSDEFTSTGEYGAYKCRIILDEGEKYYFLQYQYTAMLGFTYNSSTETFSFTRGSKILTPEMTLVSSKAEHTELLSSAEFVPNNDGIVFTNHLGPIPELGDLFINEMYKFYANSCYKPTYYSNVKFNASAEWGNNTIYRFPIYMTNNFFRTTIDPLCANYTLNDTTFLLSTWISDYMKDSHGDLPIAYSFLTLSVNDIHTESNRLDLIKMLGMINDSSVSINIDGFRLNNIGYTVRGIPSGLPNILIYSPLPKDLTFIPDKNVSHAYKLLYSVQTSGMSSLSETTGHFLTGCIFYVAGSLPSISIPVTGGSAASIKWLNNEQQYNGNSDIYNAFRNNNYYLDAFSNMTMSYTHGSYVWTYGQSRIIGIANAEKENISFNKIMPKAFFINDEEYFLHLYLSDSTGNTYREYIYTSSLSRIPIKDSIIIGNNEINYVELPQHNNYYILNTSEDMYFFISTINKLYSFKNNNIDNMQVYIIDNYNILNNDFIRLNQVTNTYSGTPEYYEGSDIGITYPTVSISYIEDNEPLDSIYVSMESSLFVNGKRVVLAKEY